MQVVRIVRIITRLNIGGPAIQAVDLSAHLAPLGFQTLLIHGHLAPGEGDMSYLLPSAGVETVYVDALHRPITPLQDIRACWQILRTIRRFRPVIVHTHTAKAGILGRIATLVYNKTTGRHHPARIVHTYHGHVFEGYFRSGYTALFVWLERALAPRTDVLVAVAPQTRDDLLHRYHIGRESQFRVVPLGFDLSSLADVTPAMRRDARLQLGIPDDASVVTTVGRLTGIKNHQLFLEMGKIVAERHPNAVFLIAGDGELKAELESLARALGLASRVRFLGWRQDLAKIYAATDVFALTSRNEGTPVALIEAMAAGVVSVSTDVGGVRAVVVGHESGLVVPSDDVQGFAAAVCELLADPVRRTRMGEEGRRAVLARYTLKRLLSEIAAMYRELIAQDRPYFARTGNCTTSSSGDR